MKTIEDNKHLLSEKDYTEWNENRMSTNAAYTKVVNAKMPKQRDLVAEAEERHTLLMLIKHLRTSIQRMRLMMS